MININLILRYLVTYLIIVIAIFSFYYKVNNLDTKKLEITQSELKAIVYIQTIYHLGVHIVEFKNLSTIGLNKNSKHELEDIKRHIKIHIDAIFRLQEFYPMLKDDKFNAAIKRIRDLNVNDQEYFAFLDLINHENYRLGDVSGLLFESDRETYLLGTLISHYMPEYLISLLLSDSFLREFHYLGQLSDEKKNFYVEQNKLVYLSSKEVDGIIKRLKVTKETQELSSIMKQLLQKLETIEKEKKVLSSWKKNKETFAIYLEHAENIKEITIKLNDKYIEVLTRILKKREMFLESKVAANRSVFSLVFILLSLMFFFFYKTKESNLLKEEEIKKMNTELDNVVLFSRSDLDGNITHISSALLHLSGFIEEEVIGENHRIFKGQGIKKDTYKDMWETISNKKVWSGEIVNKQKDGTEYWIKLTITPEINEDGNITAYNAYSINITDKKELEAEKLKTQKALEFKSRFLSNMSHEIRTPLNAIVGLTGIVIKTDLNEKQKGILEKVTTASGTLLGIINDILDISKIEAGKMKIEHISFNLKILLESLEYVMGIKCNEKNIPLTINYENLQEFHFLGDSLRITQVLNNLLSNAIKFTDDGEISISIKIIENSTVRFEVKDSGIGLKKEDIKILFQDFSQADMSTSRKYGGTGLGLSISKQLVELMGGEIWVESTYGKGSTFIFEIPLEVDTISDIRVENKLSNLDDLEAKVNSLEGKKILVAEDNKMNQTLLSMLLEDSTLELDFALDGNIAVEKFKNNKYDLILMDIQMPNMNGYDASKVIRSLDSTIPIVALSANVLQEDIKQAKDSGMDEHLSKPIETEKLYQAFLRYMA